MFLPSDTLMVHCFFVRVQFIHNFFHVERDKASISLWFELAFH